MFYDTIQASSTYFYSGSTLVRVNTDYVLPFDCYLIPVCITFGVLIAISVYRFQFFSKRRGL